MQAGRFDRIPIVDVSPLEGGDERACQKVAEELDHAARTSGFLYVRGHGVEPSSIEAVERAAASFFALPEADKARYYIGLSRNHRGYVPPGEEVFYGQTKDAKEAFDLCLDLPHDDPDYLSGNRLLGPNVWPAELPDFREAVSTYYQAVLAFGRRLLRAFARALELPESHFDAMVKKPPSQLRLVHYPAPDPSRLEEPGAMGIGSHTDYECFTILHTTGPGLEVVNAEGRWIDAPPVPGAFVINIGDMLEVLTNGRWISTAHRVRRVPFERFSFPLFFSLDYYTVVAPIPSLLARGEQPRYESLVAGEHLLAQTAQSFTYLKRELERGALVLGGSARGLSSFGRDRADSRAGGAA